jgi:CHAT domain-containing protein/tetratricopeptide (TPR) repeat protein
MNRYGILVCLVLITAAGVNAQCPDRKMIHERVLELKNSGALLIKQRDELLQHIKFMKQCPVTIDTVLVQVLQRTGALYYLLGDFTHAARYTDEAIETLRRLTPFYSNDQLLVRMYHYLNIFYDSLQLKNRQIAAIDSSVHFALAAGIVNNEILNNLMQRVDYSFNIGDYERCLSDTRIGIHLTTQYSRGPDSTWYSSFFVTQQVNSLTQLGRLQEAYKILEERKQALLEAGLKKQCGPLYNQLAAVYSKQQKYDSALQCLKNSYECNQLLRFAIGCKQSLNNIGFFYQSVLHQPAEALPYYRKALTYHTREAQEQALDRAEDANILGNIANVHTDQRQFDSAAVYFNIAFLTATGQHNEDYLLHVPAEELVRHWNLQYLTTLVRDKGDAFLKRGRSGDRRFLDSAIGIYRKGDRLFDRIQQEQRELLSQLTWRKSAKSMYAAAVEACFEANRLEDAFYFFERSRAVLLQRRMSINQSSNIDKIASIDELDRQIRNIEMQVSQLKSVDSRNDELQKSLYIKTRQRDRLHATLSHNRDEQPFAWNDFRKFLLASDAAYVSIFEGDTAVFVLYSDRDEQKLFKISKQKYTDLTRSFTSIISSANQLNERFEEFVHVSHQLYELLIGKQKVTGQRLIVSPDGTYLPFEALATNNDIRNPGFLLERAAVSYSYAAWFLVQNKSSQQLIGNKSFLGIAPEMYANNFNLHPLPGNEAALKGASDFFENKTIWTGNAATKRNFLDNYQRFSIVQLNTHAVGGDMDREPLIYFSDSILLMSELIPTGIPATSIIILSACETGKGNLFDGEGVFSFNRSFAELGIPSASVNLWSVDNRSAYRLNELFCRYLSQGLSSDIALQKAKLEYYNEADDERKLPYYWAAPVLVGRVITFDNTQNLSLTYFWWIAAVLIVIAAVMIVKRESNTAAVSPDGLAI